MFVFSLETVQNYVEKTHLILNEILFSVTIRLKAIFIPVYGAFPMFKQLYFVWKCHIWHYLFIFLLCGLPFLNDAGSCAASDENFTSKFTVTLNKLQNLIPFSFRGPLFFGCNDFTKGQSLLFIQKRESLVFHFYIYAYFNVLNSDFFGLF